jgi:hypothetical protein
VQALWKCDRTFEHADELRLFLAMRQPVCVDADDNARDDSKKPEQCPEGFLA